MKLSGARVLITGAYGGVGRAVTRAVVARGGVPVLTGRRAELLDGLAAETIAADLAAPGAIEDLVGRAGRIDVAVLNAAVPATGELSGYDIEQIDRALDVNLRAAIVLARLLTPPMVDRGMGHVVLVSSMAGKVAAPGASLYSATKFGLRGFGLALREELRDRGVGVSTVFPGLIAEAGMFAETGVRPIAAAGTTTPARVALAVVRAITGDRAEVDAASVSTRLGGRIAGVSPRLAIALQRWAGAGEMMRQLAGKQAGKR
jgi:uncharacterized protein